MEEHGTPRFGFDSRLPRHQHFSTGWWTHALLRVAPYAAGRACCGAQLPAIQSWSVDGGREVARDSRLSCPHCVDGIRGLRRPHPHFSGERKKNPSWVDLPPICGRVGALLRWRLFYYVLVSPIFARFVILEFPIASAMRWHTGHGRSTLLDSGLISIRLTHPYKSGASARARRSFHTL